MQEKKKNQSSPAPAAKPRYAPQRNDASQNGPFARPSAGQIDRILGLLTVPDSHDGKQRTKNRVAAFLNSNI
jgi:hypothetical protein